MFTRHVQLAIMATVLASPSVFALRCNGQVVSVGHHITDVIESCGTPAYQSQTHAMVGESNTIIADHIAIDKTQSAYRMVELTDMIYDFGSNRFKRKLHFINGYLTLIDKLSHGSKFQ